MIPEDFSIKWFTLYYSVFGMLMLVCGGWLAVTPSKFKHHLVQRAEKKDTPPLLRSILKYWLLFTLPCLVLSFVPFSLTELLFSVWSLLMVYLAGAQLVRWPQLRMVIKENPSTVSTAVRWLGVGMVSAAVVILLLSYIKILALDT
ncbi:hypothetical protein [Halalkalibaculum sp. DA384]|uniref:hypothetical protein n=1 Tax=Halalkalibaculum sp. DA384 TaxID=3373606 RepID=UPI003754690F